MGGVRPSLTATPLAYACLGVLIAYWAAVGFVLAVDPYDVYRWGVRPRLDPHNVTRSSVRLFSALAKSRDFDLVMAGSSTAMGYRPGDIRKVFPDARRPVNLSYSAARPKDRDLLLKVLAAQTRARRVVVWLDHFYSGDSAQEATGFPGHLYDRSWSNDLRMVDWPGILSAWTALGGRPQPAEALKTPAERSGGWARDMYRDYQSPAGHRRALATLQASSGWIADEPACESFATLNDQLLPSLRHLSARGVSVDLVIPAYSLVFFRHRMTPAGLMEPGGSAAGMLAFRRCLTLASAALPDVRIWALDLDRQMISDMANYRDPAHLYGPSLHKAFAHIGDPAYRLTTANIDRYVADTRALIVDYRITNANWRQGSREAAAGLAPAAPAH